MIGFLALIRSHNSELQVIQRYRYSTYCPVHHCTSTRVLSLHFSSPSNGFMTVSLALQITHEVYFAPPNSFLAIILQLPIPKSRLDYSRLLLCTLSRLLTVPFYNPSARTTQKIEPVLLRRRVYGSIA
jgi:hypothetical protein